jgi:hypothetical protein
MRSLMTLTVNGERREVAVPVQNVGSENAPSFPRHTAWCPPRRRVMTVGRHVITVGGV